MLLPKNYAPTVLDPNSALVSCEWLQQNLDRSELVVLDASFFLPRQQRNAKQEFKSQHIPGAHFFDIDEIADQQGPLPHTLPNAEQFSRQVGQFGIDRETWVIIYDDNHFFAAARAWWMFRVFGHDNVKVLDGGLTRWRQLSYPLTSKLTTPMAKEFVAVFRPKLFADLSTMRDIQRQGNRLILDARSEDSFNGQRPILEAGLQPGHIPGSTNIPYRHLFAEEDLTLRSVEQLREAFLTANVKLDQLMVTTCGSGVSAAILLLALFEIGIHEVPLYDGSWAEWGRQDAAHVDQQSGVLPT